MVLLHIAFQEGFTDDTVVVRVNGREVFRKGSVKTRLQIGYADSFEVIGSGRLTQHWGGGESYCCFLGRLCSFPRLFPNERRLCAFARTAQRQTVGL